MNGKAMEEGPRRKHWTIHDLQHIRPLTPGQEEMFHDFIAANKHICAHGSAGTGKTYVAVFLALNELLQKDSEIERIILIRSAVATRDLGFMPGTLEEKTAFYELPYRDMFTDFLGKYNSYDDMKDAGVVEFTTTSFIRGLTWDNTVVIVDEAQNMTWSEFDSVVTRLGRNSRLIICGDSSHQQDLKKEKTGFNDALKVMQELPTTFSVVHFTHHDIVRSPFVKEWIMARDNLGL